MLILTFLYAGIGAGIATAALGLPSLRQGIDRVGRRLAIGKRHARSVWLVGTTFAWPVGLFVLITGRLVLVDIETTSTMDQPDRVRNPQAPCLTAQGCGTARH